MFLLTRKEQMLLWTLVLLLLSLVLYFFIETSYANVLTKPDFHFVNGVGGCLRVLGKLDLPISFQCAIFNLSVHVVDRLPHSLIIGLDFMEKYKVNLDLANKTMPFLNQAANVLC